jgi:hypothetical protein
MIAFSSVYQRGKHDATKSKATPTQTAGPPATSSWGPNFRNASTVVSKLQLDVLERRFLMQTQFPFSKHDKNTRLKQDETVNFHGPQNCRNLDSFAEFYENVSLGLDTQPEDTSIP